MYKLSGKLIGIAPILFDRLLDDAKRQIAERKSGPTMTREEKIKEAYDKCYRQDGFIGLPAQNFKKCLLEGSMMLKQKRQRSALWRYLRGALFLEDSFLSFNKKKPDLIHEETGRIPPGKGGTPTQIFRPALREGWGLPFTLIIYDDTIPEMEVKQALEYAGMMVGLVAHRPEFGRFKVEWEDGSA